MTGSVNFQTASWCWRKRLVTALAILLGLDVNLTNMQLNLSQNLQQGPYND